MPRIQDEFLDCVVYLYRTADDARKGARTGGTGFLVSVPSSVDSNLVHTYVVTNSHVIRPNGCRAVRLNTKTNRTEVLETKEENWHHHPAGDDVAVTPVRPPYAGEYKFFRVAQERFLTKKTARRINLGPGDDVFVTGRFVNHEGKQRNTPTLRFGNIAMMPLEPIHQDVRGIDQESFLVDMRSISGYSGSPVFLEVNPWLGRPGLDWTPPMDEHGGYGGRWLLGIDWGHLQKTDPVTDGTGQVVKGLTVQSNTGMMAVVPAWKLQELLDCDELVAQRAEDDDWIRDGLRNPGSCLD